MNVLLDNDVDNRRRERLSRLGILVEPLGYPDGVNRYEFASDDPIGEVDPTGLDPGLGMKILMGVGDVLKIPGKVIQGVGKVMDQSNLPVITNVGKTVSSIGKVTECPVAIAGGIITSNKAMTKEGLDEGAHGLTGVIGLENAIYEPWVKPEDDPNHLTGGTALPKTFADGISRAKNDLSKLPPDEQRAVSAHGYHRWHATSNAYLASKANLGELFWIAVGGIWHEMDPKAVKDELKNQGCVNWILDTAGDLASNLTGEVGGVVLPKSALFGYGKVIGGLIWGPR